MILKRNKINNNSAIGSVSRRSLSTKQKAFAWISGVVLVVAIGFGGVNLLRNLRGYAADSEALGRVCPTDQIDFTPPIDNKVEPDTTEDTANTSPPQNSTTPSDPSLDTGNAGEVSDTDKPIEEVDGKTKDDAEDATNDSEDEGAKDELCETEPVEPTTPDKVVSTPNDPEDQPDQTESEDAATSDEDEAEYTEEEEYDESESDLEVGDEELDQSDEESDYSDEESIDEDPGTSPDTARGQQLLNSMIDIVKGFIVSVRNR